MVAIPTSTVVDTGQPASKSPATALATKSVTSSPGMYPRIGPLMDDAKATLGDFLFDYLGKRYELTFTVNERAFRDHREGILRVLGPDATLRRGYSITTNERGKLIRTVKSVEPRMRIHTRLNDGEFESTVS